MDASGAGVQFRVLGAVEALRNGVPLPLGGPRQRALLALLLLEPRRPVSTDRLAAELWAGELPEGADVTLRSYISRLRATLGDAVPVTASSAGYVIDVEPGAIDARRFEGLILDAERARAAGSTRRAGTSATSALELWSGPPFADIAGDGVLRAEAERLHELRLRALELRIEADLELGRAEALVPELETLLREHPFRERFWAQLMLALYRADRQADALAAYGRARELLADELGLEPGDELERLQVAILRHEVPLARSPEARHNLPASLTSFIGRDEELAAVTSHVRRHRLVTLTGVGGIGKTRLALEVARRLADEMDGVRFVDLAPLADPSLVPAHVAGALGVREESGVGASAQLVEAVRDRALLIVLDNCEHLGAAVADLAGRVLGAGPEVRVLATSRELLGVPGELDYPVPPLRLPAGRDAGAANRSDAVALLLERAAAARPGFRIDPGSLEVAARIVGDLDGLPLAIELAGARARVLSLPEIADRLEDRFRFLVSWRRLTSARHRTLREAMDWSYGLLELEDRRLLRALSVFVGGFTLDAVAAVATDGDDDLALRHLERLVEASLIAVESTHEWTRYTMLETVRQYGAEQLEGAGEREDVRRRHAEYFTAFAESVWHPVRVAPVQMEGSWLGRLARDRENLRATLAWQHETSAYDAMLRLTEAMWWFWWIRGELTEGRTWLGLALESAGEGDPHLRGLASLGLGGLCWAQGDLDAGERFTKAAHQLLAEVGEPMHESSALNTLGVIAYKRGDNSSARRYFERSIETVRAAIDPDASQPGRIAIATDNLGTVDLEVGDPESALAHYREALELNRARGDAEGVAMNELHIAFVEAEAGRFEEARALLARSLSLYRSLGFHQYAAECVETAAIVANGLGTPDDAAFLLTFAARLREEAGTTPVPVLARMRERERIAAIEAIGPERFDAIVAETRSTPTEAAFERALAFLA